MSELCFVWGSVLDAIVDRPSDGSACADDLVFVAPAYLPDSDAGSETGVELARSVGHVVPGALFRATGRGLARIAEAADRDALRGEIIVLTADGEA
ncbi:MAG: hypothetical protein H5U40_07555, partial [Polyangiaceae bacterium]|nr:hypothetical protein [Polyangiaceae bacterium]